nr:uncharacterized protein LOC113699812 [Coffea arabica]
MGQEQMVTRVLGFHRACFPFTYLDAPIYKGRRLSSLFDGLVAKMRDHLGHWSTKMLSFGGKRVLARHVLSSLPMYLLQVLSPPKAVITRLGIICNSFLWDCRGEKRLHWAAWEKLCFPTDEGGLGFRSFKDMARAFAAKLWWRFRSGDSIWAEFMHAKYSNGCHPLAASSVRPSHTWRRLEAIRSLVEPNIRWCVGEGLVDFWKDRWALNEPLEDVVDGAEQPHFLVSEFLTNEGWDEVRVGQWLPDSVISVIKDVPFDVSQKDRLVWLPSTSGLFTVKSAWEVLRCGCCFGEEEALLHVFVSGPIASEVWKRMSSRFGFQLCNCTSMAAVFIAWFLTSEALSKTHIRVLIPIVVCWFLWLARNQERFQGGRWEINRIIREVDSFMEQLGRANKLCRSQFSGDADCELLRWVRGSPRRRSPCAIAWERPRFGEFKFNSDASVLQGRATGGGLLRDYQGKLIFAFYKEFGDQGVLEAECMALLFGLQLCLQRGVYPSLVEVDSKALVQLVVSGAIAKWPLCNSLRKVRGLLEVFSAAISHVYREANVPADRLAAVGVIGSQVYEQGHQLPAVVRSAILLDSRGVPGVRWLAEDG